MSSSFSNAECAVFIALDFVDLALLSWNSRPIYGSVKNPKTIGIP